jgi:hypothetical protein
VHGLRGHPRDTWEDSRGGGSDEGSATSKRKSFKSIFKPKSSASKTGGKKGESNSASQKLFWPQEYLTQDIPQARVWTYGYNADVIGGLFQANNKNSISQHGRDLAVRVDREIENEAIQYYSVRRNSQADYNIRTRSCSWLTASAVLSSKMYDFSSSC